jgi:hypothetical protein
MRTLIFSLALSAALFGCKEDRDTPPPAPTGGDHNIEPIGGAAKDGGPSKPVRDSGVPDGGVAFDGGESTSGALRSECIDASPAKFRNGDTSPDGLLNGVSEPLDFNVTRVVATWRKDCADPAIVIEMSEGDCRFPEEHRLQVILPVAGIETGEIRAGVNYLTAEVADMDAATIDPIPRFLYFRPARLTPDGVWGTCTGEPGILEITDDEPDVVKGTRLQGRFSLTLSACDDSGNEPETVNGAFNIVLERGLDEACPTTMK